MEEETKPQTESQSDSAAHSVVFEYRPREFPMIASPPAREFVHQQNEKTTGFKISDVIAQQAGIADLQRKSIEDKIEELALEKLKVIEEKAYKEAYELGVIEGTQKAFEESKDQFAMRLQILDDMLAAFDKIKTQLLTDNEAQLLRLINIIARRIALKEVETDRETIVRLISSIIEDLQNSDTVVIKLSNDDLQFIESLREKMGKKLDFLQKVKLEGTEDIQNGGCVMETEFGVIDATLEQRVDRVWSAMEAKIPRLRQSESKGEPGEPSDSGGET